VEASNSGFDISRICLDIGCSGLDIGRIGFDVESRITVRTLALVGQET
jgi:hypothetical protein